MSSGPQTPPASILILGAGCFGLGTAYELAQHKDYKDTKITVIDRSDFPASDGSSIDSSRIVRADYSDSYYAKLALDAQDKWRNTWWGDGVYHEDGLVLATDSSDTSTGGSIERAQEWMNEALAVQQSIGRDEGPDGDLALLDGRRAVGSLFTQPDGSTGADNPACGPDVGYVNRRSGWVHAQGAMQNLYQKLSTMSNVTFRTDQVDKLIFSSNDQGQPIVRGAVLTSGQHVHSDLTILATGAWTPSLVDLRGIASATGQVVAYMALTPQEQSRLRHNPTIFDQGTGCFVITPADNVLKVARHGYGYANRTIIRNPEPSLAAEDETITVSLPWTARDTTVDHRPQDVGAGAEVLPSAIPREAEECLRSFLRAAYPALTEREFTSTRVCWYLDSASSDWIVDWHPTYGKSLFLATGGSGHAFKFAPVLGRLVVERLRGEVKTTEDGGARDKFAWPRRPKGDADGHVWAEQIRGGRVGMELRDEFARGTSRSQDNTCIAR